MILTTFALLLAASPAITADIDGTTCQASQAHADAGFFDMNVASACPTDRLFGAGFDDRSALPTAPANFACIARVQRRTVTLTRAPSSRTCRVHATTGTRRAR